MPDDQLAKIVAEKLGLVDLTGTESLMPAELSGGMKKRVALARALAPRAEDPALRRADHRPRSGERARISALIARTRQKLGVTSILVTHDLQAIEAITDRLAMLDQGASSPSGPGRRWRRARIRACASSSRRSRELNGFMIFAAENDGSHRKVAKTQNTATNFFATDLSFLASLRLCVRPSFLTEECKERAMSKVHYGSVRAGIFVVAGGVIIILFILALGQRSHLFTRQYALTATFENAGGLLSGAPVRVAGVNAGTVRGIEIVPRADRPRPGPGEPEPRQGIPEGGPGRFDCHRPHTGNPWR